MRPVVGAVSAATLHKPRCLCRRPAVGWDDRWDEKIPVDSPRLAPAGTHKCAAIPEPRQDTAEARAAIAARDKAKKKPAKKKATKKKTKKKPKKKAEDAGDDGERVEAACADESGREHARARTRACEGADERSEDESM